MRLIKTIVRDHKLEDVRKALDDLSVTGMTVSYVVGDGMVFVSVVSDSYRIRTGDWEG